MTLSDLKNKDVAYVESVGVGGALQMRLEEMGLVRGQRVERLYASPLGSPIVFRVLGQMVSLRRSEAALVSASPEPPADEAEAPAAAPAARVARSRAARSGLRRGLSLMRRHASA